MRHLPSREGSGPGPKVQSPASSSQTLARFPWVAFCVPAPKAPPRAACRRLLLWLLAESATPSCAD
jgi:hypothetical protein